MCNGKVHQTDTGCVQEKYIRLIQDVYYCVMEKYIRLIQDM